MTQSGVLSRSRQLQRTAAGRQRGAGRAEGRRRFPLRFPLASAAPRLRPERAEVAAVPGAELPGASPALTRSAMLAGCRRALPAALGLALRGRAAGAPGRRAVSTSWCPVGAAFDAKQQRRSAAGRETVSGGRAGQGKGKGKAGDGGPAPIAEAGGCGTWCGRCALRARRVGNHGAELRPLPGCEETGCWAEGAVPVCLCACVPVSLCPCVFSLVCGAAAWLYIVLSVLCPALQQCFGIRLN